MFEERLYQLRRERGISQEELANIIGVSRQAVQKWESGASQPNMDNLVAISEYFGVTLDYLLKGDEPGWEASDIPFEDTSQVVCAPYRTHYEYKSSTTLFGLPLVHINVGRFGLYRARGIIAVGNVATGLVSIGLISAGLLSFGCLSLGLLAMGAAALGLVALGGIALGAGIAADGLAVGWLAIGGLAKGVYAAGGLAFAEKVAAGGAAFGHIAIGDAVEGAVTFSNHGGAEISSSAVRSAILQTFPTIPRWLLTLFTSF